MQKFEPQGRKMLVLPISESENYKTETGLELVQDHIARGMVLEVSKEYEGVYEKGNVVAFSKGAGVSQTYNSQQCLWIDAKAAPDGDVWFIEKKS
jgi:hypothetical protein